MHTPILVSTSPEVAMTGLPQVQVSTLAQPIKHMHRQDLLLLRITLLSHLQARMVTRPRIMARNNLRPVLRILSVLCLVKLLSPRLVYRPDHRLQQR